MRWVSKKSLHLRRQRRLAAEGLHSTHSTPPADSAEEPDSRWAKTPTSVSWHEHQRVFLAFRPFYFRDLGPVTKRDFKKLMKERSSLFKHLEDEYSVDHLWQILNKFRYWGVYRRVEEAARRFPDLNHPLPDPPPVEDLDSESSENVEGAKDVEDAEDAEGAKDTDG